MVRTIDTVVRRENRTPSLIETSIVGETYLPILPTEAQLRKLAGRMLGILQKMVISKISPPTSESDSTPPSSKSSGTTCPRWSDSEDLAVLGFGALLEAAKPDPCLTRYPTSTPSPATNGGMAINERKLSSSTILTDLTSSSEDTSNTGPSVPVYRRS